MSTLKVDGIRSNSASSDAITLASDGTCTANITNNLSNRRLTINGDMRIAQRGVSSAAQGYQTVDRFQGLYGGVDENPTFEQVNVSAPSSPYHLPTSGDHPYKEGFRKAFGVTNGNQGFGSTSAESDFLGIRYSVEAQDIANSGWNYTDSSSFITLSFWVKSSVAQNFYGYLLTLDGTMQRYAFETGALTAFTWKKVVLKIPGNSNITIDNNNGEGFRIEWRPFSGTDETDSGVSLNTWGAFASGTRTPDSTSTWYTTNDASFQITGVQLEVGSVATDFEHRSYAQELALCQRYFYEVSQDTFGFHYRNDYRMVQVQFPQQMRATPTVSATYEPTSGWNSYQPNNTQVSLYVATADSVQANNYVRALKLDSEL